ncbi:DUF3800 domain-containing protein [Cetobacterium sp.]|uniref:DUF3800 domain-containing protein n=1 Tax=Cetobacterium sp. TaxID=2071632 RepID=UPI003EE6ACB7
MEYIYIDESGSMNNKHITSFPYFVIAKVLVKDKKKLKTVFKRFISKNIKELKNLDLLHNKMFDSNGNFKELKGSCLTKEFKIKLTNYLCKNNLFEIFFIKIENKNVTDKLYENTARAFNFVLGLSFSYYLKKGSLIKNDYVLQIDTRNVKNNASKSLEDYLNTKLSLEEDLIDSITVEYFDSEQNIIIQIADFFSNLYYSECLTNNYTEIFDELRKNNYIHDSFIFPIKSK